MMSHRTQESVSTISASCDDIQRWLLSAALRGQLNAGRIKDIRTRCEMILNECDRIERDPATRT